MSDTPCPYVTGNVTKYCTLTPLTLTDAEREAIKVAINDYELNDMDAGCWHIANTLRGLLERLSDGPQSTPEPQSTPSECALPPECTNTCEK